MKDSKFHFTRKFGRKGERIVVMKQMLKSDHPSCASSASISLSLNALRNSLEVGLNMKNIRTSTLHSIPSAKNEKRETKKSLFSTARLFSDFNHTSTQQARPSTKLFQNYNCATRGFKQRSYENPQKTCLGPRFKATESYEIPHINLRLEVPIHIDNINFMQMCSTPPSQMEMRLVGRNRGLPDRLHPSYLQPEKQSRPCSSQYCSPKKQSEILFSENAYSESSGAKTLQTSYLTPLTKRSTTTTRRVSFSQTLARSCLPLLIIGSFEGIIGYYYCPSMFADSCVLNYCLRPGSIRGLRELSAQFQLVVVHRMTQRRFSQFMNFFSKNRVVFDGVYKDIRKDICYPQDYSQIIQDFRISRDQIPSLVLILASTITEGGEKPKGQNLWYNAELPLNVKDSFECDFVPATLLIPHIQNPCGSAAGFVCMDYIAHCVQKLQRLNSSKTQLSLGDIPTTNWRKSVDWLSLVKEPEFINLSTSEVHFAVTQALNRELVLKKRQIASREQKIRADRFPEISEEQKSASEFRTELLNQYQHTKLQPSGCLHLARQYEILLSLSEVSAASQFELDSPPPSIHPNENLLEFLSCTRFHPVAYLNPLAPQCWTFEKAEVFLSEPFEFPYCSPSSFIFKKNSQLKRRKSFDPTASMDKNYS